MAQKLRHDGVVGSFNLRWGIAGYKNTMVLQQVDLGNRTLLLLIGNHTLTHYICKDIAGVYQGNPQSIREVCGGRILSCLGTGQPIHQGWMQVHHIGEGNQGMHQGLDTGAGSLPCQTAVHHVGQDGIFTGIGILRIFLLPDFIELRQGHTDKTTLVNISQGMAAGFHIHDIAVLDRGIASAKKDIVVILAVTTADSDKCT